MANPRYPAPLPWVRWFSKQPVRPIGEQVVHEKRILDQVVAAGSTQDANALESLQRGPNFRNGRDLAFRSGQFLEGILANRWLLLSDQYQQMAIEGAQGCQQRHPTPHIIRIAGHAPERGLHVSRAFGG